MRSKERADDGGMGREREEKEIKTEGRTGIKG